MTQPMLGWAALSRSALNRAEAQLVADAKGVRDEVGVLALHFGYANRFFPGTSVQQTRLRYALFVPWHMLTLMHARGLRPGQAAAALEEAEMELARRLPNVAGAGTIGRNTVLRNKPVSIPPSQSYWVALDQWGILKRIRDVAPSRADVYANLHGWHEARGRPSDLTDDEHRRLTPHPRLFHSDLPPVPTGFTARAGVDFTLTDPERDFLRSRLRDVPRGQDGQPSFLATLVKAEVVPKEAGRPWSVDLRRLADPADRAALDRARDAAALSAIARGCYQACAEHLKDEFDHRSESTKHRDHLPTLIDRHAEEALRLDIDHVILDGVHIGGLNPVLKSVQAWLRAGRFDTGDRTLSSTLAAWEQKRKGRRAKLTRNAHGQEARRNWEGAKAGKAGAIEYRWGLVRRLLHDLNGAG